MIEKLFANRTKREIVILNLLPIVAALYLIYFVLYPYTSDTIAELEQKALTSSHTKTNLTALARLNPHEQSQTLKRIDNTILLKQEELHAIQLQNQQLNQKIKDLEFASSVPNFVQLLSQSVAQYDISIESFTKLPDSEHLTYELKGYGEYKNILYFLGAVENFSNRIKIENFSIEKHDHINFVLTLVFV